MSIASLGFGHFNLNVGAGANGLPAQTPVSLQTWITNQAHQAFRSQPPPRLQPIAGSAMSALLAIQARE